VCKIRSKYAQFRSHSINLYAALQNVLTGSFFKEEISFKNNRCSLGLSIPHTGHFTPRRLGGHQGQSGQVWKISPPVGFNSWCVQTIASPSPLHRSKQGLPKNLTRKNTQHDIIRLLTPLHL
jgi:hypothetical protein